MIFNNSLFFRTIIKVALLCIVFVFLWVEIPKNLKWAYSARMNKRGKLIENKVAWSHSPHGDLAAYSVFLKKYLFVKNTPKQKLFVPDRRSSKIPFVRKFFLGIPLVYLFPVSVTREKYHYELTKEQGRNLLANKALVTQIYENSKFYKERRYHLISTLKAKAHVKWAVYIYNAEKEVNVFTLPLGYPNNLLNNG